MIAIDCLFEDGAGELLDSKSQRSEPPISEAREVISVHVGVGVRVLLEAVEHLPEVVAQAEMHDP